MAEPKDRKGQQQDRSEACLSSLLRLTSFFQKDDTMLAGTPNKTAWVTTSLIVSPTTDIPRDCATSLLPTSYY